MENETNLIRGNVRSIEHDPQYFGAYLNMARHNVFMLIKHLSETFHGIKSVAPKEDEDIALKTHFLSIVFNPESNDISNDDREKVLKYIIKRHHLPVLKYFYQIGYIDNKDPDPAKLFDSIHKFLQSSFSYLNTIRNSYTHYLALDKNTGEPIGRKKNVHEIKDDLIGLFEKSSYFSFLTNRETLKEEDFSHLNSPYYKLFEDDSSELTQNGLSFFICLFLERRHAIKFLKRLKGFKNENTPPFKATIKAFTAYTVKIAGEKMGNEDQKQSLLMQMLNELNRCPKELFQYLTPEDKAIFEPKQDILAKSNIVFNSLDSENLSDEEIERAIRELASQKRHEDRFPYFALRWMDEMDKLESIRFQINLGKIFIREYPKEILGISQVRRITKEVKVFGKLSDFSDEKTVLEKLKKENPHLDEIVFEQYHPHYNIENNNIAFYNFDKILETKELYPKLYQSSNTNLPTGFLSTNSLHKFIALLIETKGGLGENLIKEFIQKSNQKILDKTYLDSVRAKVAYNPNSFNRRSFDRKKPEHQKIESDYKSKLKDRSDILNKALAEDNLSMNQLPSVVVDYLLNVNPGNPQKKLNQHIKYLRSETKILIKKIKNKCQTPESRATINKGELATTLAIDMINMVADLETKEKITTPYYRKLQNLLAYFSVKKEDIISLAKEIKLIDKEKGHVFLTENLIREANGIIDFYLAYFQEKQGIREGFKTIKRGWFDKLLHEPEKLKNESFKKGNKRLEYNLEKSKVNIPYSLKAIAEKYKNEENLFNNDSIEKWLSNKIKLPVFIPADLFDAKIETAFSNGIHGFSSILKAKLNGDTQPFYDYKRQYDFIENPKAKIKKYIPKVIVVNDLSAKELVIQFGKKVSQQEKEIRFVQTKDRVLLLMCREIIRADKNLGLKEDIIYLKNMLPGSDNNPLDMPVTFRKKIIKPEIYILASDNEENKNKVAAWEAMDSQQRLKNPMNKAGYTWTVKDFGRFNELIHDRRLKNLIPYYNKKEIHFEELEFELDEYEKYWEKIFDLVFDLEKNIAAKDPNGISLIHKVNGKYDELQFNIYTSWLLNKGISVEKEYFENIRNRFAHGQFPDMKITAITPQKGNSLAKQIYEIFKEKIEILTKEIIKVN